MLVITRKAEQSIELDIPTSDIHITVHIFEIEGDRIKVGIDAPQQVRVLRSELQGGQRWI